MSSSRLSTACRLAVATVLAGVPVPCPPRAAAAHGLSVDDDPNRPLIQYVVLGFEHMALGWDHLLFIIGCVLLAPTVGMAAKLITLFVLGHSLTLLVATLAGWKVNVTFVDVAIAFSVVFVGALGVWRRPLNWRLCRCDRLRLRTRPRTRPLDPLAGHCAAGGGGTRAADHRLQRRDRARATGRPRRGRAVEGLTRLVRRPASPSVPCSARWWSRVWRRP